MQSQQLKAGSILKNSVAKTAQVKNSQNLSPSKININGELHEDEVRQSQNSNA
jgi:hypothetical protein